jgi:hypothetical protein
MSEVMEELCRRIDNMYGLIERTIIYIDTVHILVPHRLSSEEYDAIRTASRGAQSYRTQCPGRIAYHIQCPTARCLEQLDLIYPDHIVTRVDVAVDLLVANADTARALCAETRLIVTQPRHGKRKASDFETTRYLAGRGSPRNIAIYADRPSKITNRPAVHIEIRYSGAHMCRRRGVRRAGDLLQFDPGAYLDRDIRLSAVNWEKVDRLILAEACRQAAHRKSQHRRRLSNLVDDTDPRAITTSIKSLLQQRVARSGDPPSWGSSAVPVEDWLEVSPFIRDSAVHVSFRRRLRTHFANFRNRGKSPGG